jgi:CubicO group peptidase (beta-lactamase class C family)
MALRAFRLGLGFSAALMLAGARSATFSPSVAQSASWQSAVDKVFAPWDTRQSPGCALGIYKDGAILYERGYGMADLEHDVPIGPDTPFYIGSVSKQFTAFAAALAIQQGKVGADDSIRKYFPELPEYASAITVRHLVHHTSGLRDFYTLLSIAGRRQDDVYDNFAVLRLAARQKELNFGPGTDYLYSNTGYALLASLVGRASGMSFSAFVDANIFKPLGMTSSHVHDDDARLVKGRAYGYSGGANALRLNASVAERVGAGGVFSTVRDLIRWDENFYDGKVGGRALIDQVQTPGRLNGGQPLTYAWGLQVGRYRGRPIVEHGGSLVGYRAHLIRFPEQHFSVAVLCNLASAVPGGLARRVVDVVIGSSWTEPATGGGPGPTVTTSPTRSPGKNPTSLSSYTGRFYSEEVDATFTVTAKGDQLFAQRDTDLVPLVLDWRSGDQFAFIGGMTLRFTRSPGGAIDGFAIDAGRVRNIRFVRR